MKTQKILPVILIVSVLIISGCALQKAEPSPTPKASPIQKITPDSSKLPTPMQSPEATEEPSPIQVPSPAVSPTPIATPSPSASVVFADNATDANTLFAIDLYSKYKSKEGNLFFSPYSISSALTMTYEGAKGQTAKEMRTVLHLPENIETVRSDYAKINSELNSPEKLYNISVANALWTQKDYVFIKEYLNSVEKYYGGKATNVDFKVDTEGARKTINDWVSGKTNDKIKDIILPNVLSPLSKLVLSNAIYFKGNWTKRFRAKDTENHTFTLASGTEITTKTMWQKDMFKYGETGNIQILEMDYLGNNISMLMVLPKENNLLALEKDFSKENLNKWKNGMTAEEVSVFLPKFKFETNYYMEKDLGEMGMPTAFKYPEADFTGISPSTANSPTGELNIDKVIHKTFVEVAEYGTEAATATVIIQRAGAGAPGQLPKIFRADHPFLFIIQQKSTGNILFLGRVSDPSK